MMWLQEKQMSIITCPQCGTKNRVDERASQRSAGVRKMRREIAGTGSRRGRRPSDDRHG